MTAAIKKLIFEFCLASDVVRLNPNHHIWLVSYGIRKQSSGIHRYQRILALKMLIELSWCNMKKFSALKMIVEREWWGEASQRRSKGGAKGAEGEGHITSHSGKIIWKLIIYVYIHICIYIYICLKELTGIIPQRRFVLSWSHRLLTKIPSTFSWFAGQRCPSDAPPQ